MLIGELSTKTGLSRDTIRFYEKQGLIVVKAKDRRENNYKEYSTDTLNRLLRIKHIKEFGFTLNETSALLEMMDTNTASCKKVAQHVSARILMINQKIQDLVKLRESMQSMITDCCHPDTEIENCPSLFPASGLQI